MKALAMNHIIMGNDRLIGNMVIKSEQQQGIVMDQNHQYSMESLMYSTPTPNYGSYIYQPQNQHGHVYDNQGMYSELQNQTMMPEQSMSPSPPPPPRMYKPCVVCADKSSGYHYGVSSCEGCKGFFRRSIQKNMQYTCHKDKCCVINKITRNRCQYCRVQKCFAMGMSKEAVRNDRNKKKKQVRSTEQSLLPDDQTVTNKEMILLQQILEAHKATYSKDDVIPLSPINLGVLSKNCQEKRDIDAKSEPNFAQLEIKEIKKELSAENLMLWEKMTELSSREIIKIIDFAKKIPGFSTFSIADRITLLKASCLEIMILRLSSRYDMQSDVLAFKGGLNVTRKHLDSAGFESLTSTVFQFAQSLRELDIDELELATLSCICLISGDRSGLESPQQVEAMQEPILEAFKHYVKSRRKDQTQVYAKILMKLTDLRSISVKGAETVLRLTLEKPGELSPLITEMLERIENVRIVPNNLTVYYMGGEIKNQM